MGSIEDIKSLGWDSETFRESENQVLVELRIPLKGQVRDDTRSVVRYNESSGTVEQITIRPPMLEGNRDTIQQECQMIAQRVFGRDSGVYVRSSGKVHFKKPVNGKADLYTVEDLEEDIEMLRDELSTRDLV